MGNSRLDNIVIKHMKGTNGKTENRRHLWEEPTQGIHQRKEFKKGIPESLYENQGGDDQW